MGISKYIDAIIKYYNLSTITFGSNDIQRKKNIYKFLEKYH